jgi:hypothetical protein
MRKTGTSMIRDSGKDIINAGKFDSSPCADKNKERKEKRFKTVL